MLKGMTGGLVALTAGLLMAGCGGGSGYSSTPTAVPPVVAPNPPGAAADVVIAINGMDGGQSFAPNPASVTVGQTVAWKNNDSTTHTATQNGGGFDTGAIPSGATSAPITMSTAGTLNYHCTFHPSMVGTLNVASSSGGGY